MLRVDAARNHGRIVEAAAAAFEETGPGVTLEEVARRAGVGVATVYRLFGGRDGLVREVVVRAFRDGIAARAEAGDPWEDLVGVLATSVEVFAAHPVALTLVRGTFDAATLQAYHAVLDTRLRPALAAGVVRPELTARDLAMVVLMALAVARHGSAEDRRRYLALLLDGLRPGHPRLPR